MANVLCSKSCPGHTNIRFCFSWFSTFESILWASGAYSLTVIEHLVHLNSCWGVPVALEIVVCEPCDKILDPAARVTSLGAQVQFNWSMRGPLTTCCNCWVALWQEFCITWLSCVCRISLWKGCIFTETEKRLLSKRRFYSTVPPWKFSRFISLFATVHSMRKSGDKVPNFLNGK